MPRTSAENDRIRRATSEQILQTALSLFCDRGYYSTSIEEIAKLGVENPRVRSLYFSATLQGIMLMFSTYPENFPLPIAF